MSAVRNTMHEYIKTVGYYSEAVSCAEEALELMGKDNFHVVVTDIMLPAMGGLELTKLIKKDNASDVIVMTGYSDDYSYEEAINIGASDFVIKPVRLEELLLRLKRVLKERELTNERIRMMEKLQKLAITDGLTRLYNSRSFLLPAGIGGRPLQPLSAPAHIVTARHRSLQRLQR